jgi:hypothetical protein
MGRRAYAALLVNIPSDRAMAQLELLGDAVERLVSRAVPVWLSGGWALDFHVGEVTREHGDIDFIIFTQDGDAAGHALRSLGCEAVSTAHPDEHLRFVKGVERLSLTIVERNPSGELVTPGRWADWPYGSGALEESPVVFAGIECRTLSVREQLASELHFAAQKHGAPLRPKDVLDLERLQDLVAR